MAGTQDRAEGLVALRVSTIEPGVNPVDSLKGIDISSLPQGSTAWVNDTGDEYRWDETSTAIANSSSVVQPTDVTGAGRWLILLDATAVYDHVIESRADLVNVVAPVAGDFILPSGSYAFVGDVVLDAGETVSLEGGVEVLIWANTEDRLLTSDGAGGPTVTVSDATVHIYNLTIQATDSDQPGMLIDNAASLVRLWGVEVQGDPAAVTIASGLSITDGTLWASESVFTSSMDGIAQTGGQIFLGNCELVGGATSPGNALNVNGAGGIAFVSNSRLSSVTGSAVFLNSSAAHSWFSNCRLGTTANDAVVRFQIAGLCGIAGGLIDGPGSAVNSGVSLRSAGGKFIGNGITFRNCENCVIRNANQMESVVIEGCEADPTCANGINSSAAGIPTDGLILDAFAFSGSGSFLTGGALITSPRVNAKTCSNLGGLQAETPIV